MNPEFLSLLRCNRSRNLKCTSNRWISNLNVHTLRQHSQNTPTHIFCCPLSSFWVCTCPYICTSSNITASAPLRALSLRLTTSVSQHIHKPVLLIGSCLCHAVAVTFDILMQLPKMSANYLHTMQRHSFFHLILSTSPLSNIYFLLPTIVCTCVLYKI